MVAETILEETKKVCYGCGSDQTYYIIRKTGSRNYHWYSNAPTGLWLCEICNNQIIKNPKWTSINNKLRMNYKGKLVYLKKNPRIGVCNLCRAVYPFDCGKTDIHHVEYHDDDILKDTLEVCPRCHRIEVDR